MVKLVKILLLTVLILGCCQCRKSKATLALPPITQEGKNTVGFILNGEVWVAFAECGLFGDPCKEISARYGLPLTEANAISFQFSRERQHKSSSLSISSANNGTITTVGNKTDSLSVVFRGENSIGNSGLYLGPMAGSQFIVTFFDRQNQIISGSFELRLGESTGNGNITILKSGRFDLKFNACICRN